MKRILLSLLAVIAIAGLNGCASNGDAAGGDDASPVLSRIKETGVLRVGMSGHQPPFNARTRSGDIIGMEADLASALAESMGATLEIVERPFASLLDALKRGEVDMVMSSLTMTPRRNTEVAFAGPYFISGKAILTRSATLARAEQASDINRPDVKLAALEGSTSQTFAVEALPRTTFVPTTDYEEGIQMVVNGEVDAMIADFPICVISVLRHPEHRLSTLVSPFTFEPIGAALPPNDALFINLVQNYMRMLEGTGLMQELQDKWFMDGSWLRELP